MWSKTMSDVPIRRLMVSDFRRLEGTHEFPLDAPVVLIHGPNGTGKTSILSALELALTGSIRNMELQSDEYQAHLPFFGKPSAVVGADVAEYLREREGNSPMTVSGGCLEGGPAVFGDVAAKFYTERCYLDQASLGRLLDLYQARSGNGQSALENFVNELLGLEKLDALRDGLSDANDLRLLKKLAVGVDEAERQVKAATTDLSEQESLLAAIGREVADARGATRMAIASLRTEVASDTPDEDLLGLVRSTLSDYENGAEAAAASAIHHDLIALGGRISALAVRATTQRVGETRIALAAASDAKEAWERSDGAKVREWEAKAQGAGVTLGGDSRCAVEQAARLACQTLDAASSVRTQAAVVATNLEVGRARLNELNTRLSYAHEQSSVLVESLAALRTIVADSNWCPVCDRDFAETGPDQLLAHLDRKLADLTAHGRQLVDLRRLRDQEAAQVTGSEVEYTRLAAQNLTDGERRDLAKRCEVLTELAAQAAAVEAVKSAGVELSQRVGDLQRLLDSLESASAEGRHISSELARFASVLEVEIDLAADSFKSVIADLIRRAESEVARLVEAADLRRNAAAEATRLANALDRQSAIVERFSSVVERKVAWEVRVAEGKRRQGVAKEIRNAAIVARTAIVHRVFTDSLNEVWKSVFTRLAPNEGFVPRFGIPSATKKAFDITLETTHRSGEQSGPPQMMLSAGNLNTAALSLFVALHLAVEPLVPCLIFDDPVQAMDEVHVAQFAGLIRLLAKQNGRQVIIAVHERELFDYLALELSPAFAGDELITIELDGGGSGALEESGVVRHVWRSDSAVAI
jgi:exonuclease SbcC